MLNLNLFHPSWFVLPSVLFFLLEGIVALLLFRKVTRRRATPAPHLLEVGGPPPDSAEHCTGDGSEPIQYDLPAESLADLQRRLQRCRRECQSKCRHATHPREKAEILLEMAEVSAEIAWNLRQRQPFDDVDAMLRRADRILADWPEGHPLREPLKTVRQYAEFLRHNRFLC